MPVSAPEAIALPRISVRDDASPAASDVARAEVTRADVGVLAAYGGVRVLVTGAGGFIGRWVWRLLAEAGAEVWAVGRAAIDDPFDGAGGRLVADLAVHGELARLCRRVRPAVVVNCAGYGVDRAERDGRLMRRLNAALPAEAALAAAAASGEGDGWGGQRLVHVGSAFEYGSLAGEVDEDAAPAPRTPYAAAKLEGTRRVAEVRRATGVRAVTARVATVYGPGEHPHRLLPTLLRAAATGETVDLTAGGQERDFTHVRDVAEGLLRLGALEHAPDVVNLATGRLTTVRAFAECAMRAAGVPAERVRFGAVPYRDDEVWQGPIRIDRLRAAAGWSPETGVEDGIRAAHAAFTHQPGAAS